MSINESELELGPLPIAGEAHWAVINLVKKLGYMDPQGLCKGISIAWMKACLIHEEKTFIERINRIVIEKDTIFDQIEAVKVKVRGGLALDVKEKELIDMLAFFDSVAIHQLPGQYSDIFDAVYSQEDITSIAPFVESIDFKGTEGNELTELSSHSNIYSEEELGKYFAKISETIDKMVPPLTEPVALSLGSYKHAILLNYDPGTKQWSFMDINQWPPKPDCSIDQLVSLVRQSDGYQAEQHPDLSCFHTAIFAKTNQATIARFMALKQSLSVNLEDASKYQNIENIGIDSLAVILRTDKESARALAERPEAAKLWEKSRVVTDVQGNIRSYPATCLAVELGQSEVIEAIAKLPNGTSLLLNKETSGRTAVGVACDLGQVSVIKALANSHDAYSLFNVPDMQGRKPIDTLANSSDITLKRYAAEILCKGLHAITHDDEEHAELISEINQVTSAEAIDNIVSTLKTIIDVEISRSFKLVDDPFSKTHYDFLNEFLKLEGNERVEKGKPFHATVVNKMREAKLSTALTDNTSAAADNRQKLMMISQMLNRIRGQALYDAELSAQSARIPDAVHLVDHPQSKNHYDFLNEFLALEGDSRLEKGKPIPAAVFNRAYSAILSPALQQGTRADPLKDANLQTLDRAVAMMGSAEARRIYDSGLSDLPAAQVNTPRCKQGITLAPLVGVQQLADEFLSFKTTQLGSNKPGGGHYLEKDFIYKEPDGHSTLHVFTFPDKASVSAFIESLFDRNKAMLSITGSQDIDDVRRSLGKQITQEMRSGLSRVLGENAVDPSPTPEDDNPTNTLLKFNKL